MSTATAFVSVNYFPYCPQPVTVDSIYYESAQYIGPMSLTAAMSIYWNLEQATFSINGRSLTITAQVGGTAFPVPRDRVCEPNQWQASATWSDEYAFSEILTEVGTLSASYYVGVVANYFAPASQNAHLTTLCKHAPGPDWTAAATYAGTVFGVAATWYRYWFADYGPTYSGTDNATVTGSFYTY
jgi:hypothetical protein